MVTWLPLKGENMAQPDIWLPTYIKRDTPEPEYYGQYAIREYEETATLINDTIAGTSTQYVWLAGFSLTVTPGTAVFNADLTFTGLQLNTGARLLYSIYSQVQGSANYSPRIWKDRYPRPIRTISPGGSLAITLGAGAAGTGLVTLIVYMFIM